MTCPDCGGIVGATERTEAGEPCRCFANATMAGATLPPADEPAASDLPPTVVLKLCRTCGADLTGQKRYKDRLGYQCPPCAKEQEKQDNYGRVRCRVCGHLVVEEKLTEYEGTKMCLTCHEERVNVRRQQIKRIGVRGARTREELRRIYLMVAVAAVLLLIVLAGWLIHHGRA